MIRAVRTLVTSSITFALASSSAWAASSAVCSDPAAHRSVWAVSWLADTDVAPAQAPALTPSRRIDWTAVTTPAALQGQTGILYTEGQAATQERPMAVEYSDGYSLRRKIHWYASFATVPLFIAQYAVGQKLYDGTASESTRSTHSALAAGTAALFGVNTVTGVWNLWEARKDPNKRTKRVVHGILMLAADAGFVATGALAPESEEGRISGNRSTHRSVALTSMGVATVSYLIMLVGR